MNGILSLCDCRLSCGGSQRWWGHSNPTCCNQTNLNFFALTGGGSQKHLAHAPVPAHIPCAPSHYLAPSYLVKLSLFLEMVGFLHGGGAPATFYAQYNFVGTPSRCTLLEFHSAV